MLPGIGCRSSSLSVHADGKCLRADADGAGFQTTEKLPPPERIAVRLNSVDTDHFADDIRCIVRTVEGHSSVRYFHEHRS